MKWKTDPFSGWGGHLPTPEPEYFLRNFGADVVVMGEGEETCKELLQASGMGFVHDGALCPVSQAECQPK